MPLMRKMGTKPTGTSGSYTPIKNVAFVAREYWGHDDEIVETHDGLYDDFGGDNYVISGNTMYLGLTRGDDGCEPLTEETEAEAMERYEDRCDDYDEDYEHYHSLEDADLRVAEAVQHALRLQKFFRKQRERELRLYWREMNAEVAAEMATWARELYAEPEVDEPEVVEKIVSVPRSYSCSGYNWKSRLRREYDRESWTVTREYFSQARRCHGGTDNRRYRRNDTTGKVIGNNHRCRMFDYDTRKLVPVAVFLYNGDGTYRRLRIS